MVKAKKKAAAEKEKKICLSIAPRGKRKAVTVVQGLKTFGEKKGSTATLKLTAGSITTCEFLIHINNLPSSEIVNIPRQR